MPPLKIIFLFVPTFIFGVPVKVGLAKGALAAILFVTVVEKLASSPKAAANSFKVFNVEGAESDKFASAVVTYAVVAIFVLLSDAD